MNPCTECDTNWCRAKAEGKECPAYNYEPPRPHGEWIQVIGCDGRTIAYKCKTCGWFKPHNIMPFCENCGADMRKRGEAE